MRIKIGSRQSDLARLQAYMVGEALNKKFPEVTIEYFFKASLGDKNLTDPLWKMPEKGVFTEDFVGDLEDGDVDMVVHSWKDLPTEDRKNSYIAATLPRADLRDILFIRKDRAKHIRGNLRVYSSSPRRAHNLTDFLREHLPFDLDSVEFVSVRGNVPTRFKKFLHDDIDAFVLAKAALDRLLSTEQGEFSEVKNQLREAIESCDWAVLPLKVNPPAAAQGALAIEILNRRQDLREMLAQINCEKSFKNVQEERIILKSYGGGCHQKIGVAMVEKPYGQIFSLKGLTDSGEVLNQWELKSQLNTELSIDWQFEEAEIWPLRAQESFERVALDVPEAAIVGKNIWCSKAEALPQAWEITSDTLVWTAGLETWKKLSKRGVWVNGSAEGLGEREDMQIEALLGTNKREWVKLSHEDSAEISHFPLIATYKLTAKLRAQDNLDGLTSKKCFFWTSGSALKWALEKYPEIRGARHASGPGNTYQILRKLIGDEKRTRVFLNYEAWKAEVLKVR